jgi:hypothetical protein
MGDACRKEVFEIDPGADSGQVTEVIMDDDPVASRISPKNLG